ncbi:MAG: DNA methyltransferase [Thermodesulfovibrionales bacterium]
MKSKYQSSKIDRLLKELDWDCSDHVHHRTSLNIIHWYPASFITAIPGNIIDIFSNEGDVIWDPFCGSGTSAVEAFRKGRHFYGSDISQISILISLSKIHLIKYRKLIEKEVVQLRNGIDQIEFDLSFKVSLDDYISLGKSICSYDELKPWYNEKTLNELLLLRGFLNRNVREKRMEPIFLTIFLHIAKLACAQQKTWGHIADNVLPDEDQIRNREYRVIPNFLKRLLQVQTQAEKVLVISKMGRCNIKLADARTYSPPKPADLVVTSPPYPCMADYITSQRLDYYWLGYTKEDIGAFKKNEIGARYLKNTKSANKSYIDNMTIALTNIIKAIKSKGILVLILPDYSNDGSRKGIIDDLCSYLKSELSLLYQIRRKIDETQRFLPFQSLKEESLTIWSKK